MQLSSIQASETALMPDSIASTSEQPFQRSRAIYVLVLMSLISVLGAYDRYLVGILVEDIKRDLQVSDGQIGLLTGLGFALVYSMLAVPIARVSDRGLRIPVLSASILLWSLMTALCGRASSFTGMLLARVGVGVGEAGCVPTTQAILSDHFPRKWRGTAISVATVASGVGLTLASVGGGWIADHWGWRMAFVAGAIPGLLLAVILWATVRPSASSLSAAPNCAEKALSMSKAVAMLLRVRSIRCLYFGYSIGNIASYATIAWIPAYLMRTHSLTAGQVGATYGSISGAAMIVALLCGGILADILGRYDQRWPIWILGGSFILAFPLTLTFLQSHDFHLALLLAAPMMMVSMGTGSVVYAVNQELSGPRLRATGSALFLLFANLSGIGLGPSLVGWLSDAFASGYGQSSLRIALMCTSSAYLIGGSFILLALPSIRSDISAAETRGLPHTT